jgi:DNA-binding GntR family transcriptional regulator
LLIFQEICLPPIIKASLRPEPKSSAKDNPPMPSTAKLEQSSVVEQIIASVVQAITEGRLAPGAKIVEEKLGAHFGVSRTVARQALQQLASQKLIALSPARGAFVAIPSFEEAKQVFAARRMLEVQFVREFTTSATPAMIRELKAHIKAERNAIASGSAASRVVLLADFHVLMARLYGNHVLAELLSDLTLRCQLITLVYQSSAAAQDSNIEHAHLVKAIEAGDLNLAASLMDAHLRHVEDGLRPNNMHTADLSTALASKASLSKTAPHTANFGGVSQSTASQSTKFTDASKVTVRPSGRQPARIND